MRRKGPADNDSAVERRTPLRLDADSQGLTTDLLSEAAYRLRIMSAAMFTLFGIYFVWGHFLAPMVFSSRAIATVQPLATSSSMLVSHVSIAAGMLLSAGMFLLTHQKSMSSQKMIDMGLIYEILIAMVIAVAQSTIRLDETGAVRRLGLSWVCAWILVYPAAVPSSARKTLLAAWASALMDPLATYVQGYLVFGKILAPVTVLVFFDNYICAMLAVLPAKVIAKLGEKVKRERELGSYQLVELLGKGGMGEVWKAKHRLLARPAAIKIIRSDALGDVDPAQARMTLRRFEREAQATAALQSPHSIEIFDFGLSKDGTFYYVMELLDGFDLHTLVDRFGPIESERAAVLMAQVCHSLYDAHQSGLVHRDIKPANIFVCRKGQDSDFVKVLDFGLVKSVAGPGADGTLATVQGVTTGTPAFMAPEQALGQARIDHRADIYALGCVGYWLVSGRLVFEADTPMQMLVRHARDLPEPPSMRTENEIEPSLEAVILRCLEKDPNDRPATAKELETMIWSCEFSSRWTEARAAQWWQHHARGGHRARTGTRFDAPAPAAPASPARPAGPAGPAAAAAPTMAAGSDDVPTFFGGRARRPTPPSGDEDSLPERPGTLGSRKG